jgi:hypothetical protein
MSTALAPAVAQGLRDRFAPAPLAIEQAGWRAWLAELFPQFVTHDFAPHHEAFWEWCWAIETYGSVVPLVACWPRGHAKSTSAELGAVALGARRRRRYGLYVCRTQDQSDDHVQTIGNVLESRSIAEHYPGVADRMVGKHGNSKGWRVNRLRCANGFTIDAVGLDTAARGVKLDEQRPDFIILDDIDHEHDSLETVAKNKATITKGLLPAGTRDVAVLAVQNLIRRDGIFADLAGLEVLDEAGRPIVGPTFLQDRQLSGPVPALVGMEHETGPDGRIRLTAGTPTWVGFDLADCQEQVTRFGFTAFKSECQHDATDPAGGMFDHLEYRRCDEDQLPDLIKVAVAVDPAVSDKDGSDAHGIHADGLGEDGTIYRLASIERRMTPLTSLVAAIRLGFELGADVVVVEDDQGGDTWQSVFREAVAVVERDMPPCPGTDRPEGCGCDLHAFARWAGYVAFNQEKAGSIGSKRLRASLMLAAYELGWFIHVRGDHDLLERSLNRFPRKKPYDLVDSAFWAARELRPEITALRASRRWSVADVGVAA